jgi:hypothetical protein
MVENENPAAGRTAYGVSVNVTAERLDSAEHNPLIEIIQAERIFLRFGIRQPIARVIARHAFSGGIA